MSKKSRLIICGAVALLIVVLLCLFIPGKNKNSINVTLFYLSDDGYNIEPVEKKIRYKSKKHIPEEIVSELKKKSGKLNQSVPDGAEINSISDDGDGRVTFDLSEEFLTDNKTVNVLQTYALVKSLDGIMSPSGVSHIRITVDSEPVTSVDGIELGYLSGTEIISKDSSFKKISECILFYKDKKTNTLRGEKREIVTEFDGNPEKEIVDMLIAGPKSDELEKIISSDTEIISAYTAEGVCFVNFRVFDAEINGVDAIASIAKSLFSRSNINKVVIMHNGRVLKEVQNDMTEVSE